MFASGYVQGQQQHQHLTPAETDVKGKGKVVELSDEDWQTQFKEIEAQQHEPVADEDVQANKAIDEELNVHEEAQFGDFQSVWEGIQNENASATTNFGDEWQNEYDLAPQWDASVTPGAPPNLGDYMFEPENPYMEIQNPFDEGIRIMNMHGNLSLAALAFEAACQKDEAHVEAWERLGACQAQNEKETPAIRALETCLKLDPHNTNALMGLAVSYTNEGYDTTAYNTLRDG